MFDCFKKLWREESGQGMAEYGLILALVAVVAAVAFGTLGESITNKIGEVNAGLAGGGGAE